MIRFHVVVLLLALSACKTPEVPKVGSDAPSAPSLTTAKLVLNWVPEPEFGGWYAARETGAFTRHHLDVEIVGGGAGVPVMQLVASGQADFGIAGADEVVMGRARGVDIVPLYATYQTSPQGIMVHKERGATQLADAFSSGTLAIEPGTPYAQWLKKKYGFGKVKVVPYDGGVARFLKDPTLAQQCYVTSEPIAVKRAGAETKVFLVADDGFNPYVGVVFASSSLIAKKPDLVSEFLAATREGWRNYLDHPEGGNAVMAKLNPSMNAETFAAAAAAQRPLVENAATQAGGLGVMDKARWDLLGQQLTDLALVDKPPTMPTYP